MKKFLTLLLVIPIAMFAFAGSGKEDAVEQVTEEPTEITFWFIGDVQSQTDPYSKAIREILDGFEAEYPDIKVKVESVIWDQIDHKVKIAVKAGDPPDVTFFKGQTLAGHVNAGALQSLDKYVNTMPKEWREDFASAERAMCTSILDGNRYGFLTSIHTRMLWYRKDLIPEPPETWDELVVIAQGLTDIDRNFWGYTWYAGRHFNAVELTYCNPIWEQGGKISSEDGRAAWDNEYVANTVQMHRDFLYKYRISPTSVLAGGVTSSGGDIWTMFVGNQSAMMINGAWILGDASDGAGKPLWDAGKIGVAPIPSFPGKKPQHFANGWAIGIPTGAKHPDQAWEFIKYFESPGPQLKHSLVEGGMPTRMSAWDDPALSDPTRQFFLENIKEYGRPMDPLVFYDEALNSLAITFQELLLEPQQDIISTLEKSANEFNNKYY